MTNIQSIWTRTPEPTPRPGLARDVKKEAVVIGGGMAGILTAYFLRQEGVEVMVLERDRVGSGQTENTTAKITSQHGLIYDFLICQFGEDGAAEYARRNQQAISDYESIISNKAIDCDFQRLPAILYTKNQPEQLRREEAAARRLGICCELITETELPFAVAGALKFDDQAQFHPMKFLKAISSEMEIYEKTPVLRIKGNKVYIPGGSIEAGVVVIATHFPFVNFPGFYFTRMHQERSYVLALSHAAKLGGLYYGIDPDVSWSMRSAGDLLLLGGVNHRTGIMPARDPYETLRLKAEQFWPGCEEAARWSAQDCMPADHIPYIGQFSRGKADWYVAAGFKKWGMSHSMVSARLLTEEILGSRSGKKSIFDPRRFNLVSLSQMFKDTAVSAKNLIAAWAGATPKCRHLGCHLNWNPFEKTWECQCHGSRFSQEGRLLDNPAQNHLLELEHGEKPYE